MFTQGQQQFNRPMKRAHSPDFEDRGGFNRSFRGRPNFHKRHHSEQPFETVETKIAKCGEFMNRDRPDDPNNIGNKYINKVSIEITNHLADKTKEEENIKSIVAKICQCIVSFPSRINAYATLVGLISTKHYNVSSQIISTLVASYPIYLEAQKWQEAMTIFHTLAYLVNCKVITPNALLEQYEILLDAANEDGVPQTRSDYFVYSILASLPYVALELSKNTEQLNNFENILSSIETYLDSRSKNHLPIIQVWKTKESTSQMDYLDSLWVQIKNFRANGWIESYLIRPYEEKEYSDQLTTNLITYQASTRFQIPPHSSHYNYPLPKIVLRFFEDDATDINNVPIPGSDKIERFCIENDIRLLIDELHSNNNDLSRKIRALGDKLHLSTKHVMIETLLGELFTLPKPKHDDILYQTLIYDVGRWYTKAIKDDEKRFDFDYLTHQAVKILYDNIETMNVSCLDRFGKWFSLFLNDTGFVYPWQTWADVAKRSPNSLEVIFVKSILEYSMRFSFHKKVETMVGEHLANMVPPEPKVIFKPSIESDKNEELAQRYKHMITTKQDPPEVCRTLNVRIEGVQLPDDFAISEQKPMEKLSKIDIFFSILLNLGSRSVSHLSSGIGKYKSAIKALVDDIEGGQLQLLQTAHSCLQDHPQLLIILVDKLFKADLIQAQQIRTWIFSELKLDTLPRIYLYDILFNTMERLFAKIKRLQRERAKQSSISNAKDSSDNAQDPRLSRDVEMKIEPTDETDQTISTLDKTLNEHDKTIQSAELDFINQSIEIFKLFVDLLLDHVRTCQSAGVPYKDDDYKLKSGKMQQFYYDYYELLSHKYEEISDTAKQAGLDLSCIPNFNV